MSRVPPWADQAARPLIEAEVRERVAREIERTRCDSCGRTGDQCVGYLTEQACANEHDQRQFFARIARGSHARVAAGRYRKRPVEVEAHQWWRNGDHPDDGPADFEGKVVRYFRHPAVPGGTGCYCGRTFHVHGWIDTAEGGHVVCPGDWIITGVAGERYPCKPDIFDATYEPVEVGA